MPGMLMWTFVMQAIDTLALNLQNKWVFVMQAIDTLALNLRTSGCLSCRQLIH